MRARLAAIGADLGAAFWLAVHGNLSRLDDASAWVAVVGANVAPVVEDAPFLLVAADALPAEPWDGTTWKTWTVALTAASGRKGKALFHPLRLALTARENGPEMARLLPLIGRTRAEARLRGRTA